MGFTAKYGGHYVPSHYTPRSAPVTRQSKRLRQQKAENHGVSKDQLQVHGSKKNVSKENGNGNGKDEEDTKMQCVEVGNGDGDKGQGQNEEEPEAKCYVCGKTGNVMRCSQCKAAFYCSRDHQVKDWARHSKEC